MNHQAGHFQSNGTSEYIPSFSPAYVAPETRETFWDVIGNNDAERGPKARLAELTAAPFVYSPSTYESGTSPDPGRTSVGDLETNVIAVLKEIIEFEDKNNNGMYDADVDGDPVQRIEMACLSWTPPRLTSSTNKSIAFSGESQSWETSTTAFDRDTADYEEKCRKEVMPGKIAAGTVTIKIETSNMPAYSRDQPNVYDRNPAEPILLTPNSMRVSLRVKDFPYVENTNATAEKRNHRLAFRFLVASENPTAKADFSFFDHRRLVSRSIASHIDNGYFEWQPAARVKFPGSDAMFGEAYKEQPLRASRRDKADAGLPGESAKDGFIPHLSAQKEIPYSIAKAKLLRSYETAWVEDLILAVGGQAFEPTDVAFDMAIAFGPLPVFQTWAAQPAIIAGTLFLMMGVCICSSGGFGKFRDPQTGYSPADAAQEALHRATRELHGLKLGGDGTSGEGEAEDDDARVGLLKGLKEVEGSADKFQAQQGVHLVWVWPCRCRLVK